MLLEINSLRKCRLKGVTTRRVCGLEICSSVLWTARPVLESLWAFVLGELGGLAFLVSLGSADVAFPALLSPRGLRWASSSAGVTPTPDRPAGFLQAPRGRSNMVAEAAERAPLSARPLPPAPSHSRPRWRPGRSLAAAPPRPAPHTPAARGRSRNLSVLQSPS